MPRVGAPLGPGGTYRPSSAAQDVGDLVVGPAQLRARAGRRRNAARVRRSAAGRPGRRSCTSSGVPERAAMASSKLVAVEVVPSNMRSSALAQRLDRTSIASALVVDASRRRSTRPVGRLVLGVSRAPRPLLQRAPVLAEADARRRWRGRLGTSRFGSAAVHTAARPAARPPAAARGCAGHRGSGRRPARTGSRRCPRAGGRPRGRAARRARRACRRRDSCRPSRACGRRGRRVRMLRRSSSRLLSGSASQICAGAAAAWPGRAAPSGSTRPPAAPARPVRRTPRRWSSAASGGPRSTAWARRLAWVPSPGSLMMNG